MPVSAAGRAAIRDREGEVLHTYLDSVGVPTCCVGHTGRMSPGVPKVGQTFTRAQSDAYLAADLAPVEAVIAKKVTVPISQNERDGLASLGFNIGTSGLGGSTVIKRLNLGDIAGAADAFLMWNKPASLIKRRQAERAQFLQADPAVVAARAGALAHAATVTKASAATAAARAATVAGTGTVAVTAAVATGHPAVGAVTGLLALIATTVDGWLARARNAKATTLAANAGAHLDAIPHASA